MAQTTKAAVFYEEGKESKVNQYQLSEVLGEGGFATVVLAKNELTQEMYAMKCLSRSILKRKRVCQGKFVRCTC